MTKFLLDSGNPQEYREIAQLAKKQNTLLWGATTNPTLIAKELVGRKVTSNEAFTLQRQIVLEIISIVPGAVSAEVYADEHTTAQEMIEQGREIASWHERVVVKLPTTKEGFKARTQLRRENVVINNTLVFSQEQVLAVCLHEKLIQDLYQPVAKAWPCFISPFVGRLDDIGQNGMDVIRHAITIRNTYKFIPWILSSSIRSLRHLEQTINYDADIVTAPAKVYREYFSRENKPDDPLYSAAQNPDLTPIPYWQPPKELLNITSLDQFMDVIESGKLNIDHELTSKGIAKFSEDWKSVIQQ